jgi:hypothetical protein
MSDVTDYGMTTDDDELPLSITHSRDTIIFDGKVEQDYRFLDYRFKVDGCDVEARMYLDEPWTVSISAPFDGTPIPVVVMAYLRKRFNIVRLAGSDGYDEIWKKP